MAVDEIGLDKMETGVDETGIIPSVIRIETITLTLRALI